jgi:hypothetical protein
MIENTAVVPVAVKKIYEASDIALVYPNPFNDRLFISLKENTGNAEVSVTNILGQVVYTGGINGANKTIDFSALKSGVYFLQIETSDKRLTQKIIKQ